MALQKSYFKKLYAIAESQNGHFTAKQALAAGYSNRMQSYHVKNGDWVKEARGIFRLDSFPLVADSEVMIWYLWSSDRKGQPQGVYSHETALALHRIISWNAKRLHITVPPAFQRMVVPSVIHLHKKRLSPEEVESRFGIRYTNILRTMLDLIQDGGRSRKSLREALSRAMDRKIILPAQIAKAPLTLEDHDALFSLVEEVAEKRQQSLEGMF